jgi:hypothetical protein
VRLQQDDIGPWVDAGKIGLDGLEHRPTNAGAQAAGQKEYG